MQLAAIRRLVSVHWGIVCLLCMGAFAQGVPQPKLAPTWLSEAPRQQIIVGYSYLRISGAQVNNLPIGFLLDSNFFFNRHFGLQIESASHWGNNASIGTVEAGPILRFPAGRFAPFVHANIGYSRVSPPGTSKFGWGMSGGAGMDVRLTRIFEIRLFQADYAYNGTTVAAPLPHIDQNSVRLSTAAIWNIGTLKPQLGRPSFKCFADQTEVYAGEPVHIIGTPLDFNPKRKTNYNWSTTGGKTAGRFSSSVVDTTGLRPGTYTVTGSAEEGRASARCSVAFTVRPFPAPIAHCSVSPANVSAGGIATLRVNASSSSDRPLSYSYTTSAGTIKGAGASVTLVTAGVATGPIRITATVTDDRGESTNCETTVVVSPAVQASVPGSASTAVNTPRVSATPASTGIRPTNPARANMPVVTPTPVPKTRQGMSVAENHVPHPMGTPLATKVSELEFHPGERPGADARVDNVAKAILDDVALRMRSDPDLMAVIVGMATPGESNRTAAQRAVNTKHYLTYDAGIDPHRIDVRTGARNARTAEVWIVPAGAPVDLNTTKPVDEQRIKGVSRAR